MTYDNSQRAAAARDTRERVIQAAGSLFVRQGFVATTIRQVAEAADVSPETIYKSFGGKATLLKSVYDITLAGDDEDVPMSDRPEVGAVRNAPDPDEAATAYGELARIVSSRTDPLLRVLLGSKDADSTLATFARTIDAERLAGSRAVAAHWHGLGWVRDDLTAGRAGEILLALSSPEPRWLLQDNGWSDADISTWLTDVVRRTVLR